MIRRSHIFRSGRSTKDYSKLKGNAEFEDLCYTIFGKLTSNVFKNTVKLIDKVIADEASEEELREVCSLINTTGIYAQTLINKVNAVRELEAKLPSKTASLRRRF